MSRKHTVPSRVWVISYRPPLSTNSGSAPDVSTVRQVSLPDDDMRATHRRDPHTPTLQSKILSEDRVLFSSSLHKYICHIFRFVTSVLLVQIYTNIYVTSSSDSTALVLGLVTFLLPHVSTTFASGYITFLLPHVSTTFASRYITFLLPHVSTTFASRLAFVTSPSPNDSV